MKRCKFNTGRRLALLSLPFVLICAAEPIVAQSITSPQARIEAATRVLESSSQYQSLSPHFRQQLMEFVAGNMLFALLHELGHATVSEFDIPVLGKDEDAADSFAATRLIKIGTEFSDEVVVDTAEGWFMADLRDKKEGDPVPYYDEHGLDLQRAYQFVCFLVGSDEDKFKNLASETKLPKERQDSCKREYSRASRAWAAVLKPHLRAPDQVKTKIDVVYGDAKGNLEIIAQAARAMLLLETVAEHAANDFAWPVPFTLEIQSCGFPNAGYDPLTHKLKVCYELGADFAELYRSYGEASASNLVPK
jgi:Putative metallopeptidase